MKKTVIILACCCALDTISAQELQPAIEHARQLGRDHRYQEVIDLLSHFEDATDPEDRYIVAAEMGRAYYHLGDYRAADSEFREAVRLRPQRVETALYLQATSYLLGNRDQAYDIFREIIASGATDLYLAVTLPGERAFLADPKVREILEELATELRVDLDRGSILGVELGRPRPEVEDQLKTGAATTEASADAALTARAGPYLTWAFGFDGSGQLAQIMLHNENLLRYTPYRLRFSDQLDAWATPTAATRSLGAPISTAASGDDVVVMVWERDSVRLTFEFAPPRPPAPPESVTNRPTLRVVRIEALGTPEPDDADQAIENPPT